LHVPPHVQRLLAFLALRDRPLRRDYVSGSLWTDVSQERAFAALRTTLWRIQQVDVPLIEATSTDLALASKVLVDARELRASSQRAIASQSRLAPDDVSILTEADELLPDWYEDWVAHERDQLTQMRLRALESMCEALVASRNFGAATAVALAAIAADPLRESARILAIRVHLEAGEDVEAVRQFLGYRDRLKAELGIEPSVRMLRSIHAAHGGLASGSRTV
jgi:DNA-binding SARP family transcriptional activator